MKVLDILYDAINSKIHKTDDFIARWAEHAQRVEQPLNKEDYF